MYSEYNYTTNAYWKKKSSVSFADSPVEVTGHRSRAIDCGESFGTADIEIKENLHHAQTK